jgi:hypothetical protein
MTSDDMTPDAITDEELLATACPLIRDTGWAFYFTPETAARGAELGLDAYGFYALGRGGVLGDVEPAVVSAAFGYFNPSLVAGLWNAGKAIVSPRLAGAAFMECSAAHGRLKLADVPDVAAFVGAAERVLAATDGDAFALFAGTAAEPAADDLPGRAMQLLTILREYRGSAHLVAVRAVGLDTRTAHFVSRPDDGAMFGWGPDDAPAITDDARAKMAEAEALTDRLVRPAYAVLDQSERETLLRVLHDIRGALAT